MNSQSYPFRGSSDQTLVLFPTALERQRFEASGRLPEALAHVELVGFGPIAAAARCAQLLARENPARVLLIGIAGSFSPKLHPLGSALVFSDVLLDGVGAGSGAGFMQPSQLGLPQWRTGSAGEAIHEHLALALPKGQLRAELLTVCSASGGAAEAAERRQRFAGALAEDMEGFGVALACQLNAVPLCIVRGISNAVGERDKRQWDVDGALAAAHELALEVLMDPGWGPVA